MARSLSIRMVVGVALVAIVGTSVGVGAQSPSTPPSSCLGADGSPSPEPSPEASAVASIAGADPPVTTVTSDDGKLVLELPEGAVPEGTVITATFQSPDCRPPELADVTFSSGFYALRPAGLELAAPARLTRTTSAGDLGIDISTDTPLIALANRLADGTWGWLDGLELDAQNDTGIIELSGDVSVLGDVYGLNTGEGLTVSAEPALEVSVGSAVAIEVTLHGPDVALGLRSPRVRTGGRALALVQADGALVVGFEPFVEDPGIVSVTGPTLGGVTYGASYECTAPGESRIGVELVLAGLGGQADLLQTLSLEPVGMEGYVGVVQTCLEGTGVATVEGGCIQVHHQKLRRFLSYLQVVAAIGGIDVGRYEITIRGANNDRAVKGKVVDGVLRAKLGINDVTPKQVEKVIIIAKDGKRFDVTEDATRHLPAVFEPTFPAENQAGDACEEVL